MAKSKSKTEQVTEKRNPFDVIGKPLAYVLPLVRAEGEDGMDAQNRTVKLVLTTDTPIRHWFGTLILDHNKKSIRLDRLRSNGPFLRNHDWRQKLGRFLEAETNGKQLECMVKISRNELGEEFMRDYEDDLCTGVSGGFVIHEMILEKESDEETIYRATDWEPFEGSDAYVPADTNCNVRELSFEDFKRATAHADRSKEEVNSQNTDALNERESTTTTEVKQMSEKKEETKTPARLGEAEEIRAFGELVGENELATEYIIEDRTLAEFRAAVREKRKAKTAATQPAKEDPKEIAKRNGGGEQLIEVVPRNVQLKSFKGEGAHEKAYRSGQWLRAVLTQSEDAIQYCKDHNIIIKRMHSGKQNETGGFLVPEEFENVMIDLRLQYGVFRPNANVVPMSSDTKGRPRRTGGLTAYPIGAGVAITESTKGWDKVGLTAKKWGVLAKYENELSDDAVINLADDLAGEIAYAFAYTEDLCGFNGDGSSTYHGIVGVREKLKGVDGTIANIKGLQVASGNAYSEIVEADLLGVISKLPQYARRSGQVKWYCSHVIWATVLQRIALAKGGVTYAEMNGELKEVFLGKPVEIVEVMPTTEANSQVCLLYGNLSQAAMFGDRSGVTIAMSDSDSTDFAEDQMAVRGTERFDINVHSVGDTSVAGPIVGLITAAL